MKVAFVSDTGTGLTPTELSKEGIYCIPLQITIEDVTKLEGEEISVDEVYSLMSEGKMLKTSLASMKRCEEVFQQLKVEGYDTIFAIPICNGLSGTINMMRLVAEELGLHFDYFDCHVTAVVEHYMIVRAKQLYEEGQSFTQIKALLEQICDSTNTLLVPNDLKHLQRGGRLTPFAATLGGLLKIKPILEINQRTQGKIDVLDKVRTMSKALQKTLDNIKQSIQNDGEGYCIAVTHVVSEPQAKQLLALYKEAFPKADYVFKPLVSVVGVHTGIGCLAIQYFKKL
ncbi:MAG: DegV family protein [Erysipelotrichia bacterium]|nr:DegV family protein [Erysipelotrichia bacterium]NCC54467.1 DegV family protein [Erysipelotrichia bacterium]